MPLNKETKPNQTKPSISFHDLIKTRKILDVRQKLKLNFKLIFKYFIRLNLVNKKKEKKRKEKLINFIFLSHQHFLGRKIKWQFQNKCCFFGLFFFFFMFLSKTKLRCTDKSYQTVMCNKHNSAHDSHIFIHYDNFSFFFYPSTHCLYT